MRNLGRKTAILAAPLIALAAITAQVQSAHAASPAYEIASDHTSTCIVDTGGSVYLEGGCAAAAASENHAGLWYEIAEGYDSSRGQEMYELENVHDTSQCLTTNDSGGVYMATCGTNHVQWWEFFGDPGGGYQAVMNVHTGLYLEDSGDTVWHFIVTSV